VVGLIRPNLFTNWILLPQKKVWGKNLRGKVLTSFSSIIYFLILWLNQKNFPRVNNWGKAWVKEKPLVIWIWEALKEGPKRFGKPFKVYQEGALFKPL